MSKIKLGISIARAQRKDAVSALIYRPTYNLITGDLIASLVLNQMQYWWGVMREPFFKYREPCNADDYKPGDSWTEELGITPYRFSRALSQIATKITRGTNRKMAFDSSLLVFWTDRDRRTYYQVNEELLGLYVYLAYEQPDLLSGFAPKKRGLYLNFGEYVQTIDGMEDEVSVLKSSHIDDDFDWKGI